MKSMIFILGVVFSMSCRSAEVPIKKTRPDKIEFPPNRVTKHYQILLKAKIFGFGSKKGQGERKTDAAFKALLLSSKGREEISDILKRG